MPNIGLFLNVISYEFKYTFMAKWYRIRHPDISNSHKIIYGKCRLNDQCVSSENTQPAKREESSLTKRYSIEFRARFAYENYKNNEFTIRSAAEQFKCTHSFENWIVEKKKTWTSSVAGAFQFRKRNYFIGMELGISPVPGYETEKRIYVGKSQPDAVYFYRKLWWTRRNR